MGEGRSMVLAAAFIEIAIEHRGQHIKFKGFVEPILRGYFCQCIYKLFLNNYPNECWKINKANATLIVE